MQSIQTSHLASLSSVKPLEGVIRYRDFCLEATKRALREGGYKRQSSLVTGGPLKSFGKIDTLEYLYCPESQSLFLGTLPERDIWNRLLAEVCQYRQSSKAFHHDIRKLRSDNVYQSKLDWIRNALRVQNIQKPHVMEVVTIPSDFSPLLGACDSFGEVCTVEEMGLIGGKKLEKNAFHAAILLESLDRVDDPQKLLENVSLCLKKEGLIFVTALVSSGFDMAVLGLTNAYLFPPDRANCFSLKGLQQLLNKTGFELLEVSTPGVLDVAIVKAHLEQGFKFSLSSFEQQILHSLQEVQDDFQAFLQKSGMSSFARLMGKKRT